MLDVLDREPLVERHDIAVALAFAAFSDEIVIGAAGDGLFEDRGIGGNAGQSVLLDELLEAALGDESPGEEVEPYGLPIIMQTA